MDFHSPAQCQDAKFSEREEACKAFNEKHRWRKRGIRFLFFKHQEDATCNVHHLCYFVDVLLLWRSHTFVAACCNIVVHQRYAEKEIVKDVPFAFFFMINRW